MYDASRRALLAVGASFWVTHACCVWVGGGTHFVAGGWRNERKAFRAHNFLIGFLFFFAGNFDCGKSLVDICRHPGS